MKVSFLLAATASLTLVSAAHAALPGTAAELTEARSLIVGVTPTASGTQTALGLGGGDPLYLPVRPLHNGVVGILMDYGIFTSGPNTGQPARFVCSGALIPGGHVLTAAHCVRNRTGVTQATPTVTTYFYGGNEDIRYYSHPDVTQVAVSNIFINPEYSGFVIDQADTAILRLAAPAPDFANVYQLSPRVDLTGLTFNVVGLGTRSFAGGNGGTSAGNGAATGWIRQGFNRYDFRYGDDQFGGFFLQDSWFGQRANFAWLADFDNGLVAQDASCAIGGAFGLGGSQFCNLGLGPIEVNVAGGDSGGPQFIFGNQISTVTSFGQRYSNPLTDVNGVLDSSFGEFAGYAPVAIYRDWIRSIVPNAFVPEPGTWAMLIAGFGLVGAMARRRREALAA